MCSLFCPSLTPHTRTASVGLGRPLRLCLLCLHIEDLDFQPLRLVFETGPHYTVLLS